MISSFYKKRVIFNQLSGEKTNKIYPFFILKNRTYIIKDEIHMVYYFFNKS